MAENQPERNPHPDLLELELLRTNEAAEGVEEHVAQCRQCQEVLAQLGAFSGELDLGRVPCASTPETDKEVLGFIDERSALISTARRRLLVWQRVAWAAAAVVIIGLGMFWYYAPTGMLDDARPLPPVAARRRDINRDGQVDIVDAMLLARKLEDHEAIPGDWDFNGDGNVDGGDVDALAQEIVALGEGG